MQNIRKSGTSSTACPTHPWTHLTSQTVSEVGSIPTYSTREFKSLKNTPGLLTLRWSCSNPEYEESLISLKDKPFSCQVERKIDITGNSGIGMLDWLTILRFEDTCNFVRPWLPRRHSGIRLKMTTLLYSSKFIKWHVEINLLHRRVYMYIY